MEDQELREKLQEVWNDSGCCEILVTQDDLKELITTLMDIFQQSVLTGNRNPISLQFLGMRDANSAFINQVKIMRLHTLYKFSLSVPARDVTILTPQENEKLVLDFENKLDDILNAVTQG